MMVAVVRQELQANGCEYSRVVVEEQTQMFVDRTKSRLFVGQQLTRRGGLAGKGNQRPQLSHNQNGTDGDQQKKDHNVVTHEARGKAARLLRSSRGNFCELEEGKRNAVVSGKVSRLGKRFGTDIDCRHFEEIFDNEASERASCIERHLRDCFLSSSMFGLGHMVMGFLKVFR